MKDNLFEMLLNLFETTLTKIKADHEVVDELTEDVLESESTDFSIFHEKAEVLKLELIQSAKPGSMRVFSPIESMKLTKPSHQFLMRMQRLSVLDPDTVELVLNEVLLSDAPCVTLLELKWMIRTVLKDGLDKNQLAFLDLVLYQNEDAHRLH